MFNWQIALSLELLAVVFAFMLWFMAVKAEGGPKKLAKVVAIVVIVLAVLFMACTVTRAFLYAGAWKGAPAGEGGYKCYKMFGPGPGGGHGPCCDGHGPGEDMMSGHPCPRAEEPATLEEPPTE